MAAAVVVLTAARQVFVLQVDFAVLLRVAVPVAVGVVALAVPAVVLQADPAGSLLVAAEAGVVDPLIHLVGSGGGRGMQ